MTDQYANVQHLDQATDRATGITVITCGGCHAVLTEASYQAPAGHLDSCPWAIQGEDCDECGAFIPDTEPGMVNASHDPSCSLYLAGPA